MYCFERNERAVLEYRIKAKMNCDVTYMYRAGVLGEFGKENLVRYEESRNYLEVAADSRHGDSQAIIAYCIWKSDKKLWIELLQKSSDAGSAEAI